MFLGLTSSDSAPDIAAGTWVPERGMAFFLFNVSQGQSGLGSWPARILRVKAYAPSKKQRATRKPLERSWTGPLKVGYEEDRPGSLRG